MATVAAFLMSCNTVLLSQKDREFLRLWWSVCWVESKCDPRALNAKEGSVGIAQIRMICLKDCNRIIGYEKYRSDDRLDVVKSFEMFRLYVRYYAPRGTPEQWARIWNGGPQGMKKASTKAYYLKVKAAMRDKR